MAGIRVRKVDLAHIFGVDQGIIDDWIREGMPYLQKPSMAKEAASKGQEWLFDSAEVITWRIIQSRRRFSG